VSEEVWNVGVRAVIVDDDARLLLVEEEHSLRLPRVDVEVTVEELPVIRPALASHVGVDAVMVRSLERIVDSERKVADLGLELEPLAVVTPMPHVVWRPVDAVDELSLPDADRALVERHRADNAPPERPEWARRGWFADASAWIHDRLEEHGRKATGPIEQRSNWCISSVLHAETAEGTVYFKATARSPLFVDEGTVTRGLAAIFPGRVPRPIAVEPERRWMLLDDFGPVVGWKADLETRASVLSAFARMQVEAASLEDELLALGVVDRRFPWLLDEIASLLDPLEVEGLEKSEAQELARRGPWFAEACERLAAGAVPESIVHGDLHLSNVAGTDGRWIFFDWTDACITHPFLDLLVVLFEDNSELRSALTDAYLGVWAETVPQDELLELWALAAPVACLNQALSYRSIMASVEGGTAPEFATMPAYWLRKALATSQAST
jgi:hypothetical protein